MVHVNSASYRCFEVASSYHDSTHSQRKYMVLERVKKDKYMGFVVDSEV